jgi:uncharacterized Zn finger protein
MVAAQTRMDTAETTFKRARILRENNHLNLVLAIAKAEFNLTGINLYEFAVWMRDLAIELEDRALVITVGISAFKTKPPLVDCRQIGELAGADWLHKVNQIYSKHYAPILFGDRAQLKSISFYRKGRSRMRSPQLKPITTIVLYSLPE